MNRMNHVTGKRGRLPAKGSSLQAKLGEYAFIAKIRSPRLAAKLFHVTIDSCC